MYIIAVLVGISLFKWLYIRTSTFEDCLFYQLHLTVMFFLSLSVERELLGNLEQCIGHMGHCLNRDAQRLVLGYPLYCTWKGVLVLYSTWTLWTSYNHTPRWLNRGLPPHSPHSQIWSEENKNGIWGIKCHVPLQRQMPFLVPFPDLHSKLWKLKVWRQSGSKAVFALSTGSQCVLC